MGDRSLIDISKTLISLSLAGSQHAVKEDALFVKLELFLILNRVTFVCALIELPIDLMFRSEFRDMKGGSLLSFSLKILFLVNWDRKTSMIKYQSSFLEVEIISARNQVHHDVPTSVVDGIS
ncbi:uncharacterized protein [Euphorbia lathyris]|uniref:uncharacterized protein isoform X2 n=1 Tax=Euphorbia lathyris TaxID=212925 RepID=UPI003313E94E